MQPTSINMDHEDIRGAAWRPGNQVLNIKTEEWNFKDYMRHYTIGSFLSDYYLMVITANQLSESEDVACLLQMFSSPMLQNTICEVLYVMRAVNVDHEDTD